MKPPPIDPERHALFLDFDGTLTAIAPTPDSVRPDPVVPGLLNALAARLDGALAIVTGRPLCEIDGFLAPFRSAGAGTHGLERRLAPNAPIERVELDAASRAALDRARARLAPLAETPGALLEDKALSVVLHYRNVAPEAAGALREAAFDAAEKGIHALDGKKAVELKPECADKGAAVRTFRSIEPFRGRAPVFVGDDVSDEDGFVAAAEEGGFGVLIAAEGGRRSAAEFRLPDPTAVIQWLDQSVPTIGKDGA